MDISQVQSKAEALDLMNELVDKFGITKKENNEIYNSSKIGGGGILNLI